MTGEPESRHEGGAAALEYVGAIVLAGVLLATVSVALLQATPLGEHVRHAVCVVLNAGQGNCGSVGGSSATKPEPTEPCTVEDSRTSTEKNVSIVVVTGSNGQSLQIEELSDDTYRVTASDGQGVGVGVGVGGGVAMTVGGEGGDTRAGGMAEASAGAQLDVNEGEVWHFDSKEDLADFTDSYWDDHVIDGVVGDSGPARWAIGQLGDATGLTEPLPDADEQFVEGGFSVDASAEATGGVDSASAGVGAAEALGMRTSANGDKTYYLSTQVDGEAGLRSLGVDAEGLERQGAAVDGSMQLVTAVTYDSEGNMTSVETTAQAAGESEGLAALAFTGEGDPDSLKNQAGRAVVHSASLPTDTAENRQIANNFLLSQGVRTLGPATIPATQGDVRDYFDAARQSGEVTRQDYNYESSTPFALEGSGKLGISFGGGFSAERTKMEITDASYFDGNKMAPWTSCVGVGGGS